MNPFLIVGGIWVAASIALAAGLARFFWWLEAQDNSRDTFNFDAEEATSS